MGLWAKKQHACTPKIAIILFNTKIRQKCIVTKNNTYLIRKSEIPNPPFLINISVQDQLLL